MEVFPIEHLTFYQKRLVSTTGGSQLFTRKARKMEFGSWFWNGGDIIVSCLSNTKTAVFGDSKTPPWSLIVDSGGFYEFVFKRIDYSDRLLETM